MRDPELMAMSVAELHAEQAKLEDELRRARHTLDCVRHAVDDEEFGDMLREEAGIGGDLSLVAEEIAARVAGGAR